MKKLIEKLLPLVKAKLAEAEMRQGCTDYTPHAEQLLKEAIPIIRAEIADDIQEGLRLLPKLSDSNAEVNNLNGYISGIIEALKEGEAFKRKRPKGYGVYRIEKSRGEPWESTG